MVRVIDHAASSAVDLFGGSYVIDKAAIRLYPSAQVCVLSHLVQSINEALVMQSEILQFHDLLVHIVQLE